jgi:uncharacterized protein DUF6438
MKAWLSALALAGVSLTGCVTVAGAAPEGQVESIAYETGPCFGACPVYRVTVSRNGSGLFEGRRFTAVTGERRFAVTPEQYRSFAAQLEPLRPASGERSYSGEACTMMATDLPSADVKWRAVGGAEQHLYFYYGCDMERNRDIAERLRSAPDLLPIRDLIGAPR